MSYLSVVETVSAYLESLIAARPVRVAIDGRTASGKSSFARALRDALEKRGCGVLQTTIDGFHNPKAVRYARGRLSAEGYYFDARDLAAIRRELLGPAGPGGSLKIRTQVFDLAKDEPVLSPQITVPAGTILLVDGTFLARPELADAWDVHIFLTVSREVARARGIARDCAGGARRADVEAVYDQRYLPAFELYLLEVGPEQRANIVVDLQDFASPRIIRIPPQAASR